MCVGSSFRTMRFEDYSRTNADVDVRTTAGLEAGATFRQLHDDAVSLLAMRVGFECDLAWDGERGAVEGDQLPALEDAQRAGYCFARGADELTNLFMRKRKSKLGTVLGGLSTLAPLEQQAGKLFRRR